MVIEDNRGLLYNDGKIEGYIMLFDSSFASGDLFPRNIKFTDYLKNVKLKNNKVKTKFTHNSMGAF